MLTLWLVVCIAATNYMHESHIGMLQCLANADLDVFNLQLCILGGSLTTYEDAGSVYPEVVYDPAGV